MATSTASGFEWERSQSRSSEWSVAKLLVAGRYRSSKQMFSTVVPCKRTQTHNSVDDEVNVQTAVASWSVKTRRRDFVSVENQRYAAAAVVQMPAVGLALGGRLRKRRAGAGADPPLAAGRREAREVAVLHALLSGRARLLIPARRAKPAGPTTAQYLEGQKNNSFATVAASAAVKSGLKQLVKNDSTNYLSN